MDVYETRKWNFVIEFISAIKLAGVAGLRCTIAFLCRLTL